MRTIAHVSDLHFGREDQRLAEALLAELHALAPTLVVVSGDLTQRARRSEFAAARAFLERIAAPSLSVPGNHDIPLWDLARRLLAPLERFRQAIAADLAPWFEDDELAVLGLNTARPGNWQDGRLSQEQIAMLGERFAAAPAHALRVLVTHHPFIPAPGDPDPAVVGRSGEALAVAERCGVDLLLAGHLHLGFSGHVREYHRAIRRAILVAQAGTAISHRRRGEANSYNVITLDRPELRFEQRVWDGERFAPAAVARFAAEADGWHRRED